MDAAPHLMLVEPQQPVFRRRGLGYVYDVPGGSVQFACDHLRRSLGELHAYVKVTTTAPGFPRTLAGASYNLSAQASRDKLAIHLAREAPELYNNAEWRRIVDVFCMDCNEAEDQGPKVERLGRLPISAHCPDILERIVQAGQITSLFGPPGSDKGWLSLAWSICIQQGLPFCGLQTRQANTLTIDYEADRDTFDWRVKAVSRGLGLDEPAELEWVHPRSALPRTTDGLAGFVAENEVGYITLDSVGHAGGAPGAYGTYEGIALDVFEACAEIGNGRTAWNWIDHVSAEASREKLAGKAIGAYRKLMDARVGWEIRAEQEPESEIAHVGLFHTKWNNTRRFSPLGFRLTFESDIYGRATCVRFTREDVREQPDNSQRLPRSQRVLDALGTEKRTIHDIASELGLRGVEVGDDLRYLKKKRLVQSDGGSGGAGQVNRWWRTWSDGTRENPGIPGEKTRDSRVDGNPGTREPLREHQFPGSGFLVSPRPPSGVRGYDEDNGDDPGDVPF